MSSSSYCQGLQSCLEPTRLVEQRVLKLKMAPLTFNISGSTADNKSHTNVDNGGWSFLQCLATKTSQTSEGDKVYTPPNVKRSHSSLSEKSLDMCTESLGSETGCGASEITIEMTLVSLENSNYHARERSKLREERRNKRSSSFPPPLTSISGSTAVQVKPHREGGRLVLKAVAVPSNHTYFHVERSNGRLKLHLMKHCYQGYSNNEHGEASEEEEEEEEEAYDEEEITNCDVEDEDEDEDGNNGNAADEMGMGKLPSPSRCKEGGSGNQSLLNWEPFWVAT
ncbi:hypothetical protein K2173_018428 [Erythroxylum novogranatense]|uniref:FAF domain-containing protein n=1 Tax=Erythroxylum novogranatense TaxID=1862640 RepID=A0AAV8UBQ4_9ROSI|nr:hypothetical protein K2173_018428 [Erythroxylum novogranatense]